VFHVHSRLLQMFPRQDVQVRAPIILVDLSSCLARIFPYVESKKQQL
jgi:hypothetical protein